VKYGTCCSEQYTDYKSVFYTGTITERCSLSRHCVRILDGTPVAFLSGFLGWLDSKTDTLNVTLSVKQQNLEK
jgi:hypothetical protein